MKLENKEIFVKYDFENDILYARKKNEEYNISNELGNFIFDLNKEMEIIGVEILSVSKMFNMPKIALQNMKDIKLEIIIDNGWIYFKSFIQSSIRNALRDSSVEIEKPKPIEIMDSSLKMRLKK